MINKTNFRKGVTNYISAIAKDGFGQLDQTNQNVFIKYIGIVDLDNLLDNVILDDTQIPIYAPIDLPYPNLNVNIVALTSLIQPATCSCFINSAIDFLKTEVDIQIEYFSHDGNDMLNKIEFYNNQNQPLMISVTEEVGRLIDGDSKYKCFKAIEGIPGFLRLTSPNKGTNKAIEDIDFNKLKIFKLSHVTDDKAITNLIETLKKKKINIECIEDKINTNTHTIKHFPENPDIYKNLDKSSFALTQDFIDILSGKQGEIGGWKFLERRFIYFNKALLDVKYIPKHSITKKEHSFAKYCQRYLASRFWESINGQKTSWENIMKDNTYLRLINNYLKS